MRFPIIKIESSDLREFLREFLLGIIILCALVALNVFASAPTTPGKRGVFEQFESSLSQNLAEQLAQKMGVSASEFVIQFENLKIRPSLPQLDNYKLQILGLGALGSRRFDGLMTLNVLLESVEGNHKPIELLVTGQSKVLGPVLVSQRTLQKGERFEESHLSYQKMPWSVLPTTALGTHYHTVLGKAARSLVSPGQIIVPENIEEPSFVNNGDAIELTVFSGPGVIIRSRGIARQSGKMGESVKIEYSETKKQLMGLVTGKKSVEVRL